MMKNRIVILVAVAAFLSLAVAAIAQTGNSAPPTWYAVEEGAASGGGYRLATLTWQVDGVARGEGYQLAALTSSANGCCCNLLPLVLHDYP